jgi:hypothetical protein
MLPSNQVETSAGLLSGTPPHGAETLPPEALLKRRRERLKMLPFVVASYARPGTLRLLRGPRDPLADAADHLATRLLLCRLPPRYSTAAFGRATPSR